MTTVIVVEEPVPPEVVVVTEPTEPTVILINQGVQGPAGPTGPTGPAGPAGGAVYVHDQVLASATWTIVHNMGMFPNVTTVDTAGTVINGGVFYDSDDQITVTFSVASSGQAFLS